jgi:hypothetical protein
MFLLTDDIVARRNGRCCGAEDCKPLGELLRCASSTFSASECAAHFVNAERIAVTFDPCSVLALLSFALALLPSVLLPTLVPFNLWLLSERDASTGNDSFPVVGVGKLEVEGDLTSRRLGCCSICWVDGGVRCTELSILDKCDSTEPTRAGDCGLKGVLTGVDPGVRGLLGLGRCCDVAQSPCFRALSRSCTLFASKLLLFPVARSAGELMLLYYLFY